MKKLSCLIFVGLCCSSGTVYSSGFALIENSASGMGQAFAGAAAVAEDPSTVYFNPAGMMYLEGTQLTAGLHIINSNANFNNKGTTPAGITGLDDGGNAGGTHYVPNFYYVRDFGGQYKFGLGINAPFGLATEYDKSWMGRYTSTESEVKSININPAVSFRANEKLAIGLGFNIQYFEATLKKAINQTAFATTDGSVKLNGDSWQGGVNGGIIYEFTPQTRLGLHYRSTIDHTLEGDVKYKNVHPVLVAGAGLANKDISAGIELPATFSASLTQQINPKLTLLADITFTQWSNFKELKVVADDGSTVDRVEEKWNDTFRYSLGLKYRVNNQWIFRTGVAYDETPIENKYRTSRIPGDDRTWLSFGTSYSHSDNLSLDVGYAHLFVDNASINEDFRMAGIGTGSLQGKYDADVDILSAQITWKFD